MTSIIANAFARATGNTFDHFTEAYYANGNTKIPTHEELKKINLDIADIGTTGTDALMGGGVCLGLASVIWQMPYGEWLAMPIIIGSIAACIFGYDMRKSSHNLKEFSIKQFESIVPKENTSEELRKILFKTAKQGTIVLRIPDYCWI
jgi:hypothetical protein